MKIASGIDFYLRFCNYEIVVEEKEVILYMKD